MGPYRATSWAGTERHRRQGPSVCLPPSRPPRHVPRFLVRAGVPCEVRRVTEPAWRPYRTRKDTGHERHEGYSCGRYVFRLDGYLIRVDRRYVVHRQDVYGKAPPG